MSLFLEACSSSNRSGQTPVWLMRQAGRYLPEYRALREKYSFLEMCHQPELAVQITQMPLKRFSFDAAILFSDILMIAEAMGMKVEFQEGVGPVFEAPLATPKDLKRLSKGVVLPFITETIVALKKEIKVPLIGFCGAPFTVASYMIEGKGSPNLKKTKQWLFSDPKSFHELLDRIAMNSVDYLNQQIEAGVDAIQIFDTWAGFLGSGQFEECSLKYMEKVIKGLKRQVPVILFCKGSSGYAEKLASVQPAGVSLDWTCDLKTMRRRIPQGVAIQGNLDPDVLLGPAALIRQEVKRLVDTMKGDPGYIFNLGHGIMPDVSVDAVHVLVDTVRRTG